MTRSSIRSPADPGTAAARPGFHIENNASEQSADALKAVTQFSASALLAGRTAVRARTDGVIGAQAGLRCDRDRQHYDQCTSFCSHFIRALFALAASVLFLSSHAPPSSAETPQGRINIEYVAPKNPAHRLLYERLKERRVLERLQRLYSPFRLPTDLTILTSGCDGAVNAWYGRGKVLLCYELINLIAQPIPEGVTWAGITQEDAAVGQFLFIAGHEIGHAMFDILKLPIVGNEEDAADQFSTYLMLRMGIDEARRLISGAAYYFRRHLQSENVTLKLSAFSGEHSQPQERFYNLACMAYGANATIFAELIDKEFLPERRAKRCQRDYAKVSNALQTLLRPHIDADLARVVLDDAWLRLPQ